MILLILISFLFCLGLIGYYYKQKTKSLKSTGNDLADTFFQLDVLNGKQVSDAKFPAFANKVMSDTAMVVFPLPPLIPPIVKIIKL